MNQNKKEFKADKISLIYEFDKSSPLFVRVAHASLEKMEVDEAISILENGLTHFPEYPSAYIVYGKALAIKGNLEKAKEMITTGSELISSHQTLSFYMKEIEKISLEYANYKGSVAEDFVPETFDTGKTDENILPNLDEIDQESELDRLAKNIGKAKMPKAIGMVDDEEESKYDFDEKKIVSETLAGIYISQENYEEAISLYKELVLQNPEKAEIFNQKISELEEILRNKNN